MTFIWDAKTNFILLHFITLDQQQSSTLDIHWSSIVNDISLEISSTPSSLKNQYEYLLKNFYPKQDSKSLHSTLKHIYLHALCQQIEDDLSLTPETIYELIRHIRAKRVHTDDIEQLIKEWNFQYSSNVQKNNKERLFDMLNRLRDYIDGMSTNDYRPIRHYLTERSTAYEPSTVEKEMKDEDLEAVSDDDKNLKMNISKRKSNNDNQIASNIIEEKKSSSTRRRTRSLTLYGDNKVNIGVEWFVPKLKHQQRSSSFHARCQSSSIIDSSSLENQNLGDNNILLTIVDNDESSSSTSNSNLRRTNAQPTISWLPRTDEQIVAAEQQPTESKFFDSEKLDEVSSDSDTIEIECSSSFNSKSSESNRHQAASSSSRDLHQEEHSSRKRQRLS